MGEAMVNIVGLQETKHDVIDSYIAMQSLGPSFDGYAYVPAIDTRGGILLAWDNTVLTFQSTFVLYGILLLLRARRFALTVAGAYPPP